MGVLAHTFSFVHKANIGQVPICDGFDVFLLSKVSEMRNAIQIACAVFVVVSLVNLRVRAVVINHFFAVAVLGVL